MLISHPTKRDRPPAPSPCLRQRLAQWATHPLIRHWLCDPAEPQITSHLDPRGSLYWQIYLPTTQESFYCMNKSEVQIWLETHYPSSNN